MYDADAAAAVWFIILLYTEQLCAVFSNIIFYNSARLEFIISIVLNPGWIRSKNYNIFVTNVVINNGH